MKRNKNVNVEKYIRKYYKHKSIKQLSRELGISKEEVKEVIDKIEGIEEVPIYRFTKTDYLIAGLLFIGTLLLYGYTMTPGVAAGDAGEITSAVFFYVNCHSPGYPLYVILGKLFMWLFFFIGRVVYRLTFFTAFCGAVTVGLSYLFFLKFLARYHMPPAQDNNIHEQDYKKKLLNHIFFAKVPSFVAALYFAFSEELWAQAVIAEVYTLNAVFLPLLFLTALVFEERLTEYPQYLKLNTKDFYWNPVVKIIYLFFFLFGVALGDHHIILGYFVPFIYFLLYPYLKGSSFKWFVFFGTLSFTLVLIKIAYLHLPPEFHMQANIIILISLVLMGIILITRNSNLILVIAIGLIFLGIALLVYLLLPIRSLANAPLDWGNPETWDRFIAVITRKQYRGFAQNVRSFSVFVQQAIYLLKWRINQYTPLLFPLTFLGLYRLYKINRKWFWFSLSFLYFFDFAFGQFNNFKFTPRDMFFAKVFFIPSYMVNTFWIAVGIEFLFVLIRKHIIKGNILENKQKWQAVTALMILLSYFPLKAHFAPNNMHNAWVNDNYGRNILKTLEYKSILFTEGGDNQVFALLYLTYIEHLRPDVNIYDQKGNVFLLYGDMMKMTPQQLFESQVTNDYKKIKTGRPIYYTWKDYRRQNEINRRYNENFEYRQMGILYRVCRKDEVFTPPIDYWLYYDFAWLDYADEAVHWDYLSREIIANYNFQLGDEWIAKAFEEYKKYKDRSLSIKERREHYKKYKEYEKKAFEYYNLSKKFGYDMTAIHFNLGILLEQHRLRILIAERNDPERKKVLKEETNINQEIIKVLHEAVSNYLKAAEIENREDNAPRAFVAAARAYEKLAFFDQKNEEKYMREALRCYKEALSIQPNYRDAKVGVSRANGFLTYPTRRINQMLKELKKNPFDERKYIELARAFIARMEINRAIDILKKGLKRLPRSLNLTFQLANIYQQLRNFNEANKYWKKMLKLSSNQPLPYFYLGENYFNLKKYSKAADCYNKFLTLTKGNRNPTIQQMILRAYQQLRLIINYM